MEASSKDLTKPTDNNQPLVNSALQSNQSHKSSTDLTKPADNNNIQPPPANSEDFRSGK